MTLEKPNMPERAVARTVLRDVKRFGDRTSSFMTLGRGFRSYTPPQIHVGQVRYVETPRAWVAATEPLAAREQRATLFKEFSLEAKRSGRTAYMLPVTEELSRELMEKGYHRVQIGVEPVFDLDTYFGDPLHSFPHARSLSRKGARVREVTLNSEPQKLVDELNALIQQWVAGLATVPMGFLNQIDPLSFKEHKKIFVLEYHGEVQAFLSASPVFPRQGYFFSDYMRAPSSKAGCMELLFIESMRLLKLQGYKEVRLGLCPFAQLKASVSSGLFDRLATSAMRFSFKHVTFPLNFQSIHRFKEKFHPTSWEPLFMVSDQKLSFRALFELTRVHFPEGMLQAFLVSIVRKLKAHHDPAYSILPMPQAFFEWRDRMRMTLAFSLTFLFLHVFRYTDLRGQLLYEANGFSPGAYTFLGHLLGPFFHNNHYHFAGDLLTFLIFCGAMEIIFGRLLAFVVIALGLWGSNLLAWGFVEASVKWFDPAAYQNFLVELDYGSSNAIYAAVGALAVALQKPQWLMIPFALNGLFLCFAHQSWLSLHHLLALIAGAVACKLMKKTKQNSLK